MTRTRYLEAENASHSNYGKFLLVGLEPSIDTEVISALTGAPLLASLPVMRRLGPIRLDSIFLLDWQTQEGMLFSLSWSLELLERRFLMHPIHVCPLYWAVMRHLALSDHKTVWTRDQLVTIPDEEVIPQPGLLFDVTGKRVTRLAEWSSRGPLVVRYRNRMPADDPDGQSFLTPEEIELVQKEPPTW